MDPLQAGIAAAREGRQVEARNLLTQALQANPRSEQGWLWMSAVVETEAERRTCLEQVLAINPHNQTAQSGLDKIKAEDERPGSAPGFMPVSQPAAGEPVSPHSLPTQGMSPIAPNAGRIRRLEPQPAPADDLAQLRSAQFQPQPRPSPARSAAQPGSSGSLAAVIIIGGLSITAIAGIVMLLALWLIGWPL